MFSKLRSNYRLSNTLVKIFFVLSFVFCNWQTSLNATLLVLDGKTSLTLALATSAVLGVVFVALLPALVNFALNTARLHSVPRAEYCLIARLFFAIGFFACGLLNLVNLFTPTFLVWGSALFPYFVSLGCVIGFYRVTAKLYFNDVTLPYYFKSVAIIYLVCVVVFGVFL